MHVTVLHVSAHATGLMLSIQMQQTDLSEVLYWAAQLPLVFQGNAQHIVRLQHWQCQHSWKAIPGPELWEVLRAKVPS